MKFFQLFLAAIFLNLVQASAADFYPDLIGKTLDGKNFDLKEKRGQILIVNFWATWCIDCRRELPILDEIYQDYKAQGFEIIGVSTDRAKDRAKILQMTADKKYVNLLKSDMTKNDFPEVEFLPTSYIINRDGKVVGKIIINDRTITKKDFEDALRPLF
jgi:thiol-disulfide isomerase/thioredoxin